MDAGEPNREILLDPLMLGLCGDVDSQIALDDGCGEGRFARMLVERGARVVALDATPGLARTAASRGSGAVVLGTAEQLPFEDGTFDLVVSYLVLCDVPDYASAIREVARVLRPGGRIVYANVSFMSVNAGWVRDAEGNRLYYPVDDYFRERPVELDWAGISVINWHRPLRGYMRAFLNAGLLLEHFDEPYPPDDSLREDPRFEDWYRVPNFVVMRWRKPSR